ncbi:MAG: acylphosphatase [Parcubacteria group bacterium CG1_02_39_15]|uniref:acylphosphatase n=4 Tax=Candidatus Nealsoniibacteriota TaxID=1817911 RepID=A0A2G9YSU1_9BACT|nr:MAG: acylphosphatase [Parcubacteria group bacterium CG1_02_39_15]PIP22297.1 MAG: acylphosphatase [Candidatus Nealsonbacteria bacterium CG23_combo_of_CG06-09_8_20_14_all_39_25]PIQ98465.1 MAG: acylphosphatase [Candidatus Nealsonbacteria bacterium CG11_big_fil_rev_8_21_14_0_20_39_9]PIW90374.1 MAG: acylphosphatase [Candidatus Nealsonbacteria bacterium CG_4_8_14_3_um_filter_40_11]PIZ87922.1 MAG: acylphosphatase [Candidatus Nealsonbacteria bacterium CG_4_10_14_0_2_um_filter_39_15]
MSENIRAHIFVSGRVQGVFFRAETHQKARQLGLTGWVKNLSDGRLEAVFEGKRVQIGQMLNWAKSGPPGAIVKDLDLIWEEYKAEFSQFEIKHG